MDKAWYQSKTIYAGLIILLYGLSSVFGIDLSPYKEVIITVASGLGIIGLRGALPTKK